jgi:hypothetical protein
MRKDSRWIFFTIFVILQELYIVIPVSYELPVEEIVVHATVA